MTEKRVARIRELALGEGLPLLLVAGPCVIESRELCLRIAEQIKSACAAAQVPCVFKASFDKANRTSIESYRGPGLEEGLRILEEVRAAVDVPVLSDVHLPDQCQAAGEALDALQIPAFLSRQTDLITAAARTGKAINIKKAQFMAPDDMAHPCAKAEAAGNNNLILTDRGTSFGYHQLVSDMRCIPRMQALGRPVLFDATHSVQLPGGQGKSSGGCREMAIPLALAAVAAGADGLFLEVHPDPDKGLSDAATMLPLDQLPEILAKARKIREIILA